MGVVDREKGDILKMHKMCFDKSLPKCVGIND